MTENSMHTLAKHVLEKNLSELREDNPDMQLFAVIDPTRNNALASTADALAANARCLYTGKALEEYEDEAPWIVEIDEHSALSDYLIDEGFGERWGVYFYSDETFEALYRHFRKFVKVQSVDGQVVFWKFFNPEHLSTMLPFLTYKQRAHFLKGIPRVCTEIPAGTYAGFGTITKQDDNSLTVLGHVPNPENDLQIEDMESTWVDPVLMTKKMLDFDVKGADTHPFMTFTTMQFEAPLLFNRPKLVGNTIETLSEDYGDAMSVMPPSMLFDNINYGITLAMSYKIFDVTGIQTFLTLMMSIAPGWHKESSLNAVLKQTDLPPAERFERMLTEEYDFAWQRAETFDDPDEWIEPESRVRA